jgi:hypothetical protein
MDVVAAVSGYISKMVTAGDPSASGSSTTKMKILLLDSETVGHSRLLRCQGPDKLRADNRIKLGTNRVDRNHPIRPAESRSILD